MTMLNLNALASMSQEEREAVIEWLGPKYDNLCANYETRTEHDNQDLVLGLDKLLEGLGRGGHFGT